MDYMKSVNWPLRGAARGNWQTHPGPFLCTQRWFQWAQGGPPPLKILAPLAPSEIHDKVYFTISVDALVMHCLYRCFIFLCDMLFTEINAAAAASIFVFTMC